LKLYFSFGDPIGLVFNHRMPRPGKKPKIGPQLLAIVERMIAEVEQTVRRQIADEIRSSFAERPPSASAPRRRKSRAAGTELRAKLLAVLGSAKKQGISLGDAIKRTDADRIAVKYHLRALRTQKKAKMVGNRATARWLLV
jgi:hypothetical protein